MRKRSVMSGYYRNPTYLLENCHSGNTRVSRDGICQLVTQSIEIPRFHALSVRYNTVFHW
jgi:hypothetical protein